MRKLSSPVSVSNKTYEIQEHFMLLNIILIQQLSAVLIALS